MTEEMREFFSHADRSGMIDVSPFHCYIQNPERIVSAELILANDKRAVEEIKAAEKLIQKLKKYRQALFEKYREITASTYHFRLTLIREPARWNGDPVIYSIQLEKVIEMPGAAPVQIIRECYPGKDRYKAIKRYRELLKQHPGIDAEMDIQKKSWEK